MYAQPRKNEELQNFSAPSAKSACVQYHVLQFTVKRSISESDFHHNMGRKPFQEMLVLYISL
jgi:hypothetical protein